MWYNNKMSVYKNIKKNSIYIRCRGDNIIIN